MLEEEGEEEGEEEEEEEAGGERLGAEAEERGAATEDEEDDEYSEEDKEGDEDDKEHEEDGNENKCWWERTETDMTHLDIVLFVNSVPDVCEMGFFAAPVFSINADGICVIFCRHGFVPVFIPSPDPMSIVSPMAHPGPDLSFYLTSPHVVFDFVFPNAYIHASHTPTQIAYNRLYDASMFLIAHFIPPALLAVGGALLVVVGVVELVVVGLSVGLGVGLGVAADARAEEVVGVAAGIVSRPARRGRGVDDAAPDGEATLAAAVSGVARGHVALLVLAVVLGGDCVGSGVITCKDVGLDGVVVGLGEEVHGADHVDAEGRDEFRVLHEYGLELHALVVAGPGPVDAADDENGVLSRQDSLDHPRVCFEVLLEPVWCVCD